MNWIDSVKEIHKAINENRLVIFVGAGVSKNSNIPDWKGLIKKSPRQSIIRKNAQNVKIKNRIVLKKTVKNDLSFLVKII